MHTCPAKMYGRMGSFGRLGPYARSTTSAVFLFHCPSCRDRRLLFENYGSVFPDYQAFCACYNAICSAPYTAMVILLNQGNRGV